MKEQFTPGPWYVDGHNTRAVIVKNMDDEYDPICKCECNEFLRREENIKSDIANAHLIAAAPDMYEALKAVYADIELQNVRGGSDELNIMVQAALSKANPQ